MTSSGLRSSVRAYSSNPSRGSVSIGVTLSLCLQVGRHEVWGGAEILRNSSGPGLDSIVVELAAGSAWGPFQIERLLGRGSRGLLYRATQSSTGRSVALRIFDESLDEPTLNRFEDDTRRLIGLNHPNILRVESVGREGKLRYVVTEYVQSLSLRDCGPRPLRECCEIMLQTAKAISAAWMRLILHRNLKPENILVSPRGEAGAGHVVASAAAGHGLPFPASAHAGLVAPSGGRRRTEEVARNVRLHALGGGSAAAALDRPSPRAQQAGGPPRGDRRFLR